MPGEHEKKSRGGHGVRRPLEEVEREEGEHGTTFDCCLAFCGLQKRQGKGGARTKTIAVSTSHRDDETPGRSREYLPVVSS